MRNDSHHGRAFLIQIGPGTRPDSVEFEGRVEHVASGTWARFATKVELLAFLARTFPAGKVPPDEVDG